MWPEPVIPLIKLFEIPPHAGVQSFCETKSMSFHEAYFPFYSLNFCNFRVNDNAPRVSLHNPMFVKLVPFYSEGQCCKIWSMQHSGISAGFFLQQQGSHRSPSAWAVPNYRWHRMHKEWWQTPASQRGAPWRAGAFQSRGSHLRLGEPKKPTQPDGVYKAWRKAPPDVERWSPIRRHGSGKAGGLVMQSVLVVSLWVH